MPQVNMFAKRTPHASPKMLAYFLRNLCLRLSLGLRLREPNKFLL